MSLLLKMFGIKSEGEKVSEGHRWAVTELIAGKEAVELLAKVENSLKLAGPNPFDNEAKKTIIEFEQLRDYARLKRLEWRP